MSLPPPPSPPPAPPAHSPLLFFQTHQRQYVKFVAVESTTRAESSTVVVSSCRSPSTRQVFHVQMGDGWLTSADLPAIVWKFPH
jgi:hypothetical protein